MTDPAPFVEIYVISSSPNIPAGRSPALLARRLVIGLDLQKQDFLFVATDESHVPAFAEDGAYRAPILAHENLFGQVEPVPVVGPPIATIPARIDPEILKNARDWIGVAIGVFRHPGAAPSL